MNEKRANVLYIADNRNRENFGCRATSIALYQLLDEKFDIVGTISGKYTLGEGLYFKPLPKAIYKLIGNSKKRQSRVKLWNVGTRILFTDKIRLKWFSWVGYDMEKNVNNLLKILPANPELEELNLLNYDFDIMVINGEGTMIMTEPPRIDTLIYLMYCWWGKKLGKKVYFVNAMFSDCPVTGRNKRTVELSDTILKECDLIAVRDKFSLRYIEEYMPNCKAAMYPDALFSWKKYANNKEILENGRYCLPYGCETNEMFDKLDFTQAYICVSGSSLSVKNQESAKQAYEELVSALKEKVDVNVYLLEACSGDRFLREVGEKTNTPCITSAVPILAAAKILQQARVYISGRYHPAILSSLGGTPCVFFGSNSHKTSSLQEVLEYESIEEYSANPKGDEISTIIKKVEYLLQNNSTKRFQINAVTEKLSIQATELIGAIDCVK